MTTLDILMTVLDEERSRAVIDHRNSKRAKLTEYAAKLLVKQFSQCTDPNEAADEMILRGWTGFRPEWVRDRVMQRARPRTVGDSALQELIEGQSNGEFERMLHAGKPVRHPQEPDTAQILTLPFVRHG